MLGSLAGPACGEILINEFLASNASTNLDPDFFGFSDWIELHNSGATAIELEGYYLTDDLQSPTKWPIPSVTIEAGGFQLFWADGRTGADTLLIWHDETYRVVTPDLHAEDVSVFDDIEGDGWELVPNDQVELGFQDTVVHQGNTALALQAETFQLRARTSSPVNGAGLTTLRFSFHPGTATGRTFYMRFLYANQNGGGLVSLLGASSDGIGVDMDLKAWQQVEIPIWSLGLDSPIEQIFFAGDLKGTFYLDDLRLDNDRKPALHTNFQLRGEGEEIGLFDPDGVQMDAVEYESQASDVSFGRRLDGDSDWSFFATPTPGAANSTEGLEDSSLNPPPDYSLPGGFYTGIRTVQLSAAPGAVIHYSLDGSIPTAASSIYTAPLDVTSTSVIRARVFSDELLPSETITHTYFIDEESTLPVVSVATNPANLWDDTIGIYVDGTNGIISDDSGLPKNSNQDWERPVSVEFFEPGGSLGFQLDAGGSIYGAFSRHFPQKSLGINARGKYGTDEINYQIFPDARLDRFKSFILRNAGNDWTTTMLDDEFMQTLVKGQMDIDTQAYRPAVVFLNGEYWGIHNIREKLNRHYLASHHGVDPDLVSILEADSAVKTGSAEDYDDLVDFMEANDMTLAETYAYVGTQLDINEFMNHQIVQVYLGAGDNFFKNVKYWHPGTDDGRWRWFLYDTDHGFSNSRNNTLSVATNPNARNRFGDISWGTFMLRKLLENATFRDEFIQRFARHVNTTFDPARVSQIADSLQQNIAPEMPRHIARWRGQCATNLFGETCHRVDSMADWNREVEKLRTFAPARAGRVRGHVVAHFGLSGTASLTLESSPAGKIVVSGGVVPDGEGVYFKDVPLKIRAVPNAGFRFLRWQGVTDADSSSISVVLTTDATLSATFEAFDAVEGLSIAINEIMAVNDSTYADEHGDYDDWIELYNRGDEAVDVGGLYLTDNLDQPTKWQLPLGSPDSTTIESGGFLVLWADGDTDQGILHLDLKLSGSGEQIGLLQISGLDTMIVDSLSFGEQTAAVSFGRFPDGDGDFSLLTLPSPGEANATITLVEGEDQAGSIPQRFALADNHPNPFNPVTTINYDLAAPSDVRLTIYTVTGQRVATLVSAHQQAGRYQATWDARGQASGIYLYRIEAGAFRQAKRMLLLK
ncbi:MAG: T9SS type A sorting domain-containing protein [Gemmatimonadetes bacterium]|nr:T9SS type A sorting domain-containing protein [Gemmatimonadota bacterium]